MDENVKTRGCILERITGAIRADVEQSLYGRLDRGPPDYGNTGTKKATETEVSLPSFDGCAAPRIVLPLSYYPLCGNHPIVFQSASGRQNKNKYTWVTYVEWLSV